jgi:hypothetical protein
MGKDKQGKFHPKKGKPSGEGTRKGIPDIQPGNPDSGSGSDDLKIVDPNHKPDPANKYQVEKAEE